MKYFFAVMMLIIINISCFFVFIRIYKNIVKGQIESIKKKSDELEALLDSGDEMIHELNLLSDYIITHVEQADSLYKKVREELDSKTDQAMGLVKSLEEAVQSAKQQNIIDIKSTSINDNTEQEQIKSKKINHPKYIEVINLAQQGIDTREIAKRLKMGQGEVSLLLQKSRGQVR